MSSAVDNTSPVSPGAVAVRLEHLEDFAKDVEARVRRLERMVFLAAGAGAASGAVLSELVKLALGGG